MKKIVSFLFIFAVAVLFAGCTTFNNFTETLYPESEPYKVTILVGFNDGIPSDEVAFQSLTAPLLAPLQTAKTNATPIFTQGEIKIFVADFEFETTKADTEKNVIPLSLELTGVPDIHVTTKTDLFRKKDTITYFNPIIILSPDDNFTYMVTFPRARRASDSNAMPVSELLGLNYERMLTDDGKAVYVYRWITDDDMVFTDYRPNYPIYYIIAIAITAVVGTAVYFVARSKQQRL